MSASTHMIDAHRLAAKACGRLSMMLAIGKVKRALVEESYNDLKAAVEALEPVLALPVKPATSSQASPQSQLDMKL